MTVKIVTVVGARPQFIKAAVVCRAIASHNARGEGGGRGRAGPRIEEALLHTGQHYDANMSQVFFDELAIPAPRYNLGAGSGPHGRQTADMLAGIERVLLDERPDIVVVYGDTNSTLAGALAAAKLCIPVAHVEAGLRSGNRRMPEEINRILTDAVSALLLCPTRAAVENLAREGRSGEAGGVHRVGDVMCDSVAYHLVRAEAGTNPMGRLGLSTGDYFLATVHRAENVDDAARLGAIVETLGSLDRPVIWPMHPRARAALEGAAGAAGRGRLRVIDPVPYGEMLVLQKHARAVLTDSGGMQKEAYLLGVPCVTLREETEWTELVEIGANRLAGADPAAIGEAVRWAEQRPRGEAVAGEPLYGDGRAGERIVEVLVKGKE